MHSLAFSPDGKRIACSNTDEACLDVWNVNTRERAMRIPLSASVGSVSFCPTGRRIAVGNGPATSLILNASSGEVLRQIAGSAARFSPDGRWLVTHEGGKLVVRHATTFELAASVPCRSNLFAVSHDGRLIAFKDADSLVVLWEVAGQRVLHRLQGHVGDVNCLAFCLTARLQRPAPTTRALFFGTSLPVRRRRLSVGTPHL